MNYSCVNRRVQESAASPSSEGNHGDLFEALDGGREVCLDIESCPVCTIERPLQFPGDGITLEAILWTRGGKAVAVDCDGVWEGE